MTPQRHECHGLAQDDKQRKGPQCLMAEAQQTHTAHSRLALCAPDNKGNTNEGLWDAAAATMGEELTPRVIKNIIFPN